LTKKINKRLTVLSKNEIKQLYSLPEFNDEQRALYFHLNESEKDEMESLRSIESRLYFILQLAYFKCRNMFFDIKFNTANKDIGYILCEYFPGDKFPKKIISQKTQLENKSRILNVLGFRLFDQKAKEMLEEQALQSIKVSADSRYIFDTLIDFLERNCIAIPGYSTLQEIISISFKKENERLNTVISENIPKYVDDELNDLLEVEDQIYGITVLKKDANGFNYTEIIREIKKKTTCNKLFKFANKIIGKLGISDQNIRYYASLVDYYTVNKLNELSYEDVRLYLICYIFYRFQKINDNLVTSFVYHTNDYHKKAEAEAKKEVQQHNIVEDDQGYDEKIGKLVFLYVDESIPNEETFGNVRGTAFKISSEKEIPKLIDHIEGKKCDSTKFKWDHYHKMSKSFCKTLRPLVRSIDFKGEKNNTLMVAVNFIKDIFNKGKSLTGLKEKDFPKDFIPSSLKKYLYTTEIIKEEGKEDRKVTKFSPQKYEFLVYEQLLNQVDSGKIVVNESINYKSFNDDLINDEDWKDKENIFKKLNNPFLNTPFKAFIAEQKEILDPLVSRVNERIKSGGNKDIKIKEGGHWTLPYLAKNKEVNHPFFAQIPKVGLNNVIKLVNKHCPFMNEFTHIKPRYSKTQADEESIHACIVAEATGYGIYQMADISDIGYHKLLSTHKNFVRLENLKKANDVLSNGISELTMFKQWNLMDNKLFSSLDGKKVTTRRKNIMARFSTKYFGLCSGLVSYSMIANHVCVNTKIIGANQHESHYLFDIIFNNTCDIDPDYASGDTHSINRVNFILLHLIGKKFVPYIKNISKKSTTIYSFGDPALYEGSLIVPQGKIDTKLILEEEDNIKRIFASLLLKGTTQSVVVRKLSSYTRNNKTLRALRELDKILMSIHVLRFIDDPLLRRCIRTALNRGEAYHQLSGKIMSINGSKLRGTTELELQIANECCRLIANIIIYYNTFILSRIYEDHDKLGNTAILEFLKKRSSVAWRHLNMNGRYEFSTAEEINIEVMIANLVFKNAEKFEGGD
jgi:TnpA family transposase